MLDVVAASVPSGGKVEHGITEEAMSSAPIKAWIEEVVEWPWSSRCDLGPLMVGRAWTQRGQG